MMTSQHLKRLAFIWLFFILIIGGFAISGINMTTLSRDPSQLTHQPFYIGLLSNLGVLMWCAAAAVSLFSSVLIRVKKGSAVEAKFLQYIGILTTILLFDDLLMVHDIIFPKYLHLSELFVYFGYFIYMSCFLLKFYRFILEQTEYKLFILAFIFFGASIAMDTHLLPGGIDVEDGFKILGITSYSYYCIIVSARLLSTLWKANDE